MPQKKVKRPVIKEVFVPYEMGDEKAFELQQQIVEVSVEISRLEGKAKVLRDSLKVLNDQVSQAIGQLAQGKLVALDCEEVIDYDNHTVQYRRLDTREIIEHLSRELTEEDYQANAFDTDTNEEEAA